MRDGRAAFQGTYKELLSSGLDLTALLPKDELEAAELAAAPSAAAAAAGAAVAVGSRAHLEGAAIARRSALRNLLMHAFHALVTVVGGVRGIRDTQCGFKLLSRDAARLAFGALHIERWAFDVELSVEIKMFRIRSTWSMWDEFGERDRSQTSRDLGSREAHSVSRNEPERPRFERARAL